MKQLKIYIVMLVCIMIGIGGCAEDKNKSVMISLKQGAILDNLKVEGEDNPFYCNLEENMRGGGFIEEGRILLCEDPVYNITYYVNYGRDYFIYAIQGGESKLVLEIPASELYCRNGELYFMAESYGVYEFDGFVQGNIIKYNPIDGTAEIVVDQATSDMVVYPDGVGYDVLNHIEKLEDGTEAYFFDRYYYSFETNETITFESLLYTLDRWKEYWIVIDEDGGVSLADRNCEKVKKLENLQSLPYRYWVKDEFMYYVEANELMRYNFETNEKTVVSELGVEMHFFDDFIIYNDVAYFGNLLRVSLNDDTQYYAAVKDKEFGPGYYIPMHYTDGENLYCINEDKLWKLAEIQMEETGHAGHSHEKEEAHKVEFGCYEYELSIP